MTKVEIQLSKTKILLILAGAIVFIILGILFILSPENYLSPVCRSPELIRITGIASVLFFGAAGIYGIRKLFDKSIGLVVDENGIMDNTNASSIGLIEWKDITEIKTEQVMSTKFLLIYTVNPDKYLNRVGGFKRKLLSGNMKMYGTPFSITSNTLKYNFNDLEELLNDRLRRINEMP